MTNASSTLQQNRRVGDAAGRGRMCWQCRERKDGKVLAMVLIVNVVVATFVTMASFPPSATRTPQQQQLQLQPEHDPAMVVMTMAIVTRRQHDGNPETTIAHNLRTRVSKQQHLLDGRCARHHQHLSSSTLQQHGHTDDGERGRTGYRQWP